MASAALVLTTGNDQQIATGIRNLDVGGTMYDVDFISAIGNAVYGTVPRTYDFDNLTDAMNAITAINTELNDHIPSTIELVGEAIKSTTVYSIGYKDINGDVDRATGDNFDALPGNRAAWADGVIDSIPGVEEVIYADFTESGPGDPPPTAGSLSKQITCPAFGATVLPPGERIDIDDIIVSANQDQVITLKFSPADFIITKLSMKAREPAVINISGIVESPLEEQSIRLDCNGNGKLFITVVGSKTGM
jgi:hypothetical protein